MTIPIYVIALICVLVFCFASDIMHMHERGHFITAAATLAGLSFIINVSVNNEPVKYVWELVGFILRVLFYLPGGQRT